VARPVGALLVLLAAVALAASGGASTPTPPSVPWVHYGACPMECCTYGEWTVEKDTVVRVDRRDGARVAFRLRRGEKVEGVTGVVVTTKLGRALVTTPTTLGNSEVAMQEGDVLYVLHPVREGYWYVWARGHFESARIGLPRERCAGECAIRMLEVPTSVWWAQIRNDLGQEGWSRRIADFGDVDGCR
jgi:hypothetical protein